MERIATARGPQASAAPTAQDVLDPVGEEALYVIDLDGRLRSWSRAVRRLLGWEAQDWVDRPVQQSFTPEDVRVGVPLDRLRRAAAGAPVEDSGWRQRADGGRVFTQAVLSAVLDARGALAGFVEQLREGGTWPGAAREGEQAQAERVQADRVQAERIQAERVRADVEVALRSVAIESASDGVLLGDAGGITYCNAAARRLLGAASVQDFQVDAAAMVRRFRFRRERGGPLLPPAELPLGRACGEEPTVVELWATRPADGVEVLLRCMATHLAADGRPAGSVVVLSDLTERIKLRQKLGDLRRAQNALHGRDAELRALTAGVRDYAIFTLDTGGRITSWPPGAQIMKGWSAEEAIGMPFGRLFTPEERAAGRPQIEMEEAARSGEYKGEGLRMRKDGSRFDAAVVLTALRGSHGELLGFLKLTQDVTRQRAQEREREELLRDTQAARAEAESANHSKGEFLALISHELRTPLSAIMGWAQVLERGGPDPATLQHGLAAISRNARTQIQLIEDLLDMSRIEADKLRLDLQRIELGSVVAAAVDSALPAAAAKGVGLTTRFSAAGSTVMGDAARLQQVVGNLLNNAIKFTPAGGHVSVVVSQSDGQAHLEVSDTGQGIAPEFLNHLFDRFQQQEASTTRRHGGLGLGLSIVRHLVRQHGGCVRARSAGTGQGASFTVTLPALDAAPQPAAPAAAAGAGPQAPRLDGVSVLLVDDEPDIRTVTARLLQEAGARVLVARGADEALQLLRQQRPDMLLSDIGMPDVDGYELMRRVRRLPADEGGRTPAAAFTAFARTEDKERARSVGYQLHLAKPVPPHTLMRAVATLAQRGPVGPDPGPPAPLS